MLNSCKEVEDDARGLASLVSLLGVLDLRVRRFLVRGWLQVVSQSSARVNEATYERSVMVERKRYRFFIPLLVCLLMGAGAVSQTHEEIASRTGLDPDLFAELSSSVDGAEVKVFAVFVTERTFTSKISSALQDWLLPYVGRNALYVNPTVKDVVSSFPFLPTDVTVEQEGRPAFVPEASDWVEITTGFLVGSLRVNPAGATYGSGSEGILVMGDRIDSTRPFTLVYRDARARFEIAQPPAAVAVPGGREPVTVPPVASVTDLGDALGTGDFSSTAVASLLQVDPALVGTITVKSHTEELRLVLVRLEAAIRESALEPLLLLSLEPLIGKGAVMVWALSSTGAAFTPFDLYIQQSGTNYVFFSESSFVELVPGFVHARRVDRGEIEAGIVLLPSGVRPDLPFDVRYGPAGITFPNVPPQ